MCIDYAARLITRSSERYAEPGSPTAQPRVSVTDRFRSGDALLYTLLISYILGRRSRIPCWREPHTDLGAQVAIRESPQSHTRDHFSMSRTHWSCGAQAAVSRDTLYTSHEFPTRMLTCPLVLSVWESHTRERRWTSASQQPDSSATLPALLSMWVLVAEVQSRASRKDRRSSCTWH